MSAPTILAGLRQLLAAHLPFSAMASADLDFVVENIAVAYYEPDEIILTPSAAVPAHCVIVKQGAVQGLSIDPVMVAFEAGVGDCFPVGALLANRPATLTYRAVGDTFCLLLPREKFEQLTRRSAVFLDFCTRRLGSMLDLARRQLQQGYATEASVERTMATPLGELARKPPVTCHPDTSLSEAFRRMHDARVGSIVVVVSAPEGERVVGMVTRTDLIGRVILPELPLTHRIDEVMTRDPLTLDANFTAADATLMMAEHSIRHIPIVQTVQGQPHLIGVVSERDLFTLQRLGIRSLSAEIRRANSIDALVTLAADTRQLSRDLVAQGVAAAHLTRLISHLNDRLTTQLLSLITTKLEVSSDSYCWLSFGSEGRQEQTIATDQDNGIVFVADAIARDRLLELANRVNAALAVCGFPLCKGNIMASNPQWCLTSVEWEALFSGWIDRGDPDALLSASIFFDLRPLYGNTALGSHLHYEVSRRAANNPRFLKQLAANALRNRPPVGGLVETLFGGRATTHVDLKMHGTVPFVDAARIWAYANGLSETNTSERLTRLVELGRLPATDVRGWTAAFEYFQILRLREQHAYIGSDSTQQNPNQVELVKLSALDRRVIAEAFRQVRKLQQRLELDFLVT